MKTILITLFLFTIFVSTISVPVSEILGDISIDVNNQIEHHRVKRLTCDILSVEGKGFKLNDAACAAGCLLKLKRGGWCDERRVCNCR
ncbi:unnamed protein product [Psylliodes chrysocephalus]|uniref:Invertebrate defensins family profile domain-containing protein n=1 Tax=Psylliodes chrysocephalus TaxID=3402493 RepID=A0A9P0D0L2_9CUCU|nr:unnamed protein product [Psylliodes chrysocephala]